MASALGFFKCTVLYNGSLCGHGHARIPLGEHLRAGTLGPVEALVADLLRGEEDSLPEEHSPAQRLLQRFVPVCGRPSGYV